jgi:phenol hydroxylase P0 protein
MTWSDALVGVPAVDLSRRFVRVIDVRADGLVSFEFSIGWPELALELMLPAAAFREFCSVNAVTLLTDTPLTGGNPGEIEK